MASDTVMCECCHKRTAAHVCAVAGYMFLCDDCNAAIVERVGAE